MAKKVKKSREFERPPVLAFERRVEPSDGLFSAGRWDDREGGAAWKGLAVTTKSVRGTISNELTNKGGDDPAKLDPAVKNPNPQSIDVCVLPNGFDTLRVKFTLKVLGRVGVPSMCTGLPYKNTLEETIERYKETHGFSELSRRYACNLANGRFLWRNRFGAESLEVKVTRLSKGREIRSWIFDPTEWSLREFDMHEKGLEELAAVIERGLKGDEFVLLDVVAYARLGEGQEVFPSQELIQDKGKFEKKKTLYSQNDVAGFHSQKIGNAIRTIDTWYPEETEYGPIPIEPYGAVTAMGKAFRLTNNFYDLLDKWILDGQDLSPEDQHYVVANLIRGGVFGSKKESKDNKEKIP